MPPEATISEPNEQNFWPLLTFVSTVLRRPVIYGYLPIKYEELNLFPL